MANNDQEKKSTAQSQEELAMRLQSLLEEPWSPVADAAPAAQPRTLQEEPAEREEQPLPTPRSSQTERSRQQERPSWYQPSKTQQPPKNSEKRPRRNPKPSEEEERVPEPRKHTPEERSRGALLFLRDIAYILAVLTILFTFFVRISRVKGDSMYPSLVNKDQTLLLSSIWYRQPQRGDIVVARVPQFSQDPIVKRVIAVEGDTVDIDFESGEVFVNGKVLEEPYINAPTNRSFGDQGTEFPLTVEKDHVFLMGDNRNDSYDSRYAAIGQVDQRCIMGKAVSLLWPGWDDAKQSLNLFRIGLIK